jgi:AraC-like DNA-binding protein
MKREKARMASDGRAQPGKFSFPPGETFDLTLVNVDAPCRRMMKGIGAFMMLKGSAVLEINGECRALSADGLALVSDRDVYSIYSDGPLPGIALVLNVSGSFLERECPEVLDFRYDCGEPASDEGHSEKNKFFGAKRSLIRMMLACHKRGDGDALEARRALMDFLHNVYMNFRASPAAAAVTGRCEVGGIASAVSFMHENYRYGVSLADAAARAGMSRQYFSRRFKQKMGAGFLEYLNKIRLDGAVRDLLATGESILKIAMNNGFSGSKPLTALFKKVYGQTPQSYRHRKSGKGGASKAPHHEKPGEPVLCSGASDGPESLLKYAAIYDIRRDFGAAGASESISVSLKPDLNETPRVSLPGKIFKVGRLAEALCDEIREQLAEAQKKLSGDYIYFGGIFGDGIAPCPDGSFFKGYDSGRIFDFFLDLGLTPFVRADLSIAPRDLPVGAAVSDFLGVMLENRPLRCWRKGIRIEIVNSGAMSDEAFAEGFCEVYRAAKACSLDIGVGFHSVSSSRSEEWARFRGKLSACAGRGCAPDFLSITIDPSLEENFAAGDESSYLTFKNYGASQIKKLRHAFSESSRQGQRDTGSQRARDGQNVPEIYVTEWNTLAGRTPVESSAFFRAALIASELLSYGNDVSAAAYWLNSKSKETMTGKVDSRVLALYFYGRVKRPPYYLLCLMEKLGRAAAHQSERLVATFSSPGEQGEYAALIMNPCYFDPLYSVEEAYVSMEKIRVEARISGIPKGLYRFKSFIFEKKHSSALDRLSRAGLMLLADEDITLYLEHSILPEFNIFEEEIDKTFSLAPELGYNGVALYLFKKIR